MAKQKKSNHEAKLLVATTYWFVDQAYKTAEIKRGNVRDITLVAIPKGETVGPVVDDANAEHWLTHGERETVEMEARALQANLPATSGLADYCTVDVAKLRAEQPEAYAKLLKHKSTRRTTHDCLTWADKPKHKGRCV